MKYGQNFAKESVPEWSIHNIDYNSLKHFIKANTTKDQAKAIVIPGQPDLHLAKVENELYNQLRVQHDSAGLFVSAKADEISRRLQHLSAQVQRLIAQCNDGPERMIRKGQRRFARLERDALKCGNDIQYLQRFVNAQAIAFRKILKKYRKWTGSSTLSNRFRDDVLTQPKSFIRRDFQSLQEAYEELLSTIQASSPMRTWTQSAGANDESSTPGVPDNLGQSLRRVTIHSGPPETHTYNSQAEQGGYWNEYENGSENGDAGDEYVLYINPDEETDYGADLKAIVTALAAPFSSARSWVKIRGRERRSLLSRHSSSDISYGAADGTSSPLNGSYFGSNPARPIQSSGSDSQTAVATDGDEDDFGNEVDVDYASSVEFPTGYETHWATLPSVSDQRMTKYRDQVMFMVTSGLYAISFLLLGISTVLMLTGRHKLRVEVDAGVTIGSVVSLGCACTALALTTARWDSLSVGNKALVTVTFAAVCVLNGMLLILVMGNTSL